jgi:MFS family permease
MSSLATTDRSPVGLVALLSIALLVNYVDRGTIATAAPLLEKELSLSASEMGWVLAAFYWAYAPLQPCRGLAGRSLWSGAGADSGFLLWSMATAASGLAGGLVALIALRMLMGAGESTFYPSALSLLSRHVPPVQRARSTATMQFGAVLGPAIGTLLGGLLMVPLRLARDVHRRWDSRRCAGCWRGDAGCALRAVAPRPRAQGTIRPTR